LAHAGVPETIVEVSFAFVQAKQKKKLLKTRDMKRAEEFIFCLYECGYLR